MDIFPFIISFIEAHCEEHKDNTVFCIEVIEGKKLSIGLTIKDSSIISIEVLPNMVCDLGVIEINTDKYTNFQVEYFKTLNELKDGILNYVIRVTG